MLDQFSHFVRERAALLPQPEQVLTQARLVAIDLKRIEPDAALWLLGVVVLDLKAKGRANHAGRAHEKGAFGDGLHRGTVSERGNLLCLAQSVMRRCQYRSQARSDDSCDEGRAEGMGRGWFHSFLYRHYRPGVNGRKNNGSRKFLRMHFATHRLE